MDARSELPYRTPSEHNLEAQPHRGPPYRFEECKLFGTYTLARTIDHVRSKQLEGSITDIGSSNLSLSLPPPRRLPRQLRDVVAWMLSRSVG